MFCLEILAILLLIHGSYGIPIFIWLLREERREKTERGVEIVPITKRLGMTFGRFFESFTALLLALFFYLVLTFSTYVVLAWNLPDNGRAAFITYEVATGSDPKDFRDDVKQFPLWLWILAMHVVSWLIVPVLAATAVDAAYRVWEGRKAELERSERKKYGELLDIAGISTEMRTLAMEKLEEAKRKAIEEVAGKK
ncbi:MAG: hypothetical protein AABN33_15040 [Acidobacteriota bacterium]